MKCVIDSRVVLLRAPEGPLAAYLKPFAGSLKEQGYARYSIHRKVLLAAGFSRWLKQQGVAETVSGRVLLHSPACARATSRDLYSSRYRICTGSEPNF